jgi:UDP-N-acetylmuramate dehydrogenase
MERFFKRRKLTQPAGMPSAGSVFKNPGEQSAGKLIEQAGLKGLSVGGAQVSLRHANFIVNTGSASASDVFALVGMVQDRVFSSSGIRLEPEIKMLGNFDAGRREVGTGFAG